MIISVFKPFPHNTRVPYPGSVVFVFKHQLCLPLYTAPKRIGRRSVLQVLERNLDEMGVGVTQLHQAEDQRIKEDWMTLAKNIDLKAIVEGMGIPRGFVFGDLQYSTASIRMDVWEEQIKMERAKLELWLDNRMRQVIQREREAQIRKEKRKWMRELRREWRNFRRSSVKSTKRIWKRRYLRRRLRPSKSLSTIKSPFPRISFR